MKKNLLLYVIVFTCMVFSQGCASNKKTYERGWIGGNYLDSDPSFFKKMTANYFKANVGVIPALPNKIKKAQSSAVFVSRVYDDTPAMNAGMEEGDLIIAINRQKVETIKHLREFVDESKPGEKIIISVYREGDTKELPLIVGKETYQKWGYFGFGFRLGTEFNPIPYPGFSLLNIISYKTNHTRLELNSPEYRYYQQTLSLPPDQSDRNPQSNADMEGWDAWFVIFGISRKKIILDQEVRLAIDQADE